MASAIVFLFLTTVVLSGVVQQCDSKVLGQRQQNSGKVRICYYVCSDDLTPDLLNATVCSHILTGAGFANNSIVPSRDADVKLYGQLVDLKKQNPDLKLLFWTGGSKGNGFDVMAASTETRATFVDSAVQLLKKYSFDGVDIDWEFPVYGGRPEDKQNFADLLRDMHDEFKKPENDFLLTSAVAAVSMIIDVAYDVPALAQYVDYLNIMCYDYHYYMPFTPYTGMNAPLYNRSSDFGYFARANINWTTAHWIEKGMPPSKIAIGLPTYGHTYELASADDHDVGSSAVGPGMGGGWTNIMEMCQLVGGNFTRVFDVQTMSPYAYRDTQWASYDDVESLVAKTEWVKNTSLAGVMIFDFNSDDWKGSCDGVTKFPLMQAIANTLLN